MPLEVITNDASSLTDADLDEMGSIEGAFDIGAISKAKEDWVLTTAARIDGKLHGFMFSTLERIGGTPCVLIGMLSVRRNSKRDTVIRGLMGEAYHRALMAFPDEDVVVGSRFVSADGLEAFDKLDEVTPAPGVPRRRRGARLGPPTRQAVRCRRQVRRQDVRRPNGQSGFLDFESSKPEKLDADVRRDVLVLKPKSGDVMIAYGWTMAEDLVKLGKR